MAVELAQWRLFLTAADHGSLLKAAETLHTDQPALSRSLRRLEQQVGGALFLRSSKGLALTGLGTQLLGPVRELVDHAAALEGLAAAEARRVRHMLKIGSVDVFPVTTAIAMACQALATNDHPVATEVVGLPWLAHSDPVLDRTVDIGFTLIVDNQLPDPDRLRAQVLWEEPLAAALISDRHPLAEAERLHPLDLADMPLHLPNRSAIPDVYDLVLEMLADAGVPAPRRAPTSGQIANVIQHIAAGSGWMVSTHLHLRNSAPGTVAKPLAVTSRHSVHFVAIWHADTDQAVATAFTYELQKALSAVL
jgi:DNA-binding transcriptional LysR family regulator